MGGPHWRPARFRAVHLAVGELAVAAGLLGFFEIVLAVVGPLEPARVLVLFPVLGGIYVTMGMVASVRRPSNQMGALLVLGGVAWSLPTASRPHAPQSGRFSPPLRSR